MNRNILFVAALLLASVYLSTSCTGIKHKEEIRTIDSLILVNERVAEMLQSIDTVMLHDARKTFARNWVTVKLLVDSLEGKTDLRDDEFWQYVVSYSATDRSLKKLHRRFNNMKSVHKDNEYQLQTLRKSVKKDQIPEDSMVMFIAEEAIAVYNTHHEAEMYLPDLKRTIHVLDSLHQFVPEAVDHLRKINAQPKTTM